MSGWMISRWSRLLFLISAALIAATIILDEIWLSLVSWTILWAAFIVQDRYIRRRWWTKARNSR
jgi:hypothetical protein